ncbi:TonB-dependent receptor [Galbibacter sp. EGI 63066]|uniref:TonB-dependent receptor family protein n=1 Tax=Galbibacter sp. EGI 63066 TaxID=2993559 RepID=UPI00224983D5|nr:TonB-dependent receptor [Galbibacter sp. EGI 63066]MCX2680536.1 TonB-dependent receptor [Galbibacter sp. EGI 63066]
MNRITLLLLLSVCVLSAQKKEQDTLTEVILESKALDRNPLVIPIDQINIRDLERHTPSSLIPVLNETPGIHIFSGALNTNRLTIRGIGSRTPYGTNKIQAYFNGIPITGGTGETTFNNFNPESFESIEIIKGPKATPYGTNLGGALLMNTKQPESGKIQLNEHFTLGSFGLLKNSLSAGYGNDSFYFNLISDKMLSDGYRENSRYDRDALLLDMGFTWNENNSIQFLFSQINYKAEIASSINYSDFIQNPKKAANNWMAAQGYEDDKSTLLGVSYTHTFSEKLKNTTAVFYSYSDHYEPRPFNILDEFTGGYGFRSVFSGGIPGKLKNKFNIGTELYTDTYNWNTIENLYEENNRQGSLEGALLSDNREYRSRWNTFADFSLCFNKFVMQLGLNFNSTSYSFRDYFNQGETNKNAKREFDAIWAPSLNLQYHFTPQHQLFVNFSYGFSYPSLEETLTPDGVINPEIGPETGMNYELGTENFFFDRKLKVSATVYYMDVENLLVADRVGEDQYIGRNAGETSHKGLEFQLKYITEIFPGGILQPYVNATFNRHEFVDFVSADNDFSGNKLTGVPENIINGGIDFRHQIGFYATASYRHIGSIPMNDENTIFNKAYNLINLKAGYKTSLFPDFDIEFTSGINNLFDKKYAASVLINAIGFGGAEPRYYYPGLPVNYFGGIKLHYVF